VFSSNGQGGNGRSDSDLITTTFSTSNTIGETSGDDVFFASGGSGGGGDGQSTGAAPAGGGGNQASAGQANSGGGAGGGNEGGSNTASAGSGVVIVRIPKGRSISVGVGLTYVVEENVLGVFTTYCFTSGTDSIVIG
jgi:hypothetical protein